MTVLSLAPECFYGQRERQASLGSVTLTECRYEPSQALPLHRHHEAFISFVIAGSYEERVTTTCRTCDRGAVVLHPPNEVHSDQVSRDGARVLGISLASEVWARVTSIPRQERPVPGVHTGISSALAAQVYLRLRRGTSRAAGLAIEGLALTLLAEICPDSVGRETHAPRWLRTILELLRHQTPQGMSLLQGADKVGVHPTHFARIFRRHVGETFGDHVRRLRVTWASEELRRGDRSLSQIALDGGFTDQAHFCRVFRRLTGLTPGAYRRQLGR